MEKTEKLMSFTDLLYQRKSIREFSDYLLSDAQIVSLMEAATRAPNACNLQSWHFYVTINRDVINDFYPDVYGGMWVTDASVIIVVCTDAEKLEQRFGDRGSNLFAVQDTAAAINNILLQATNMGLGGCWIGAFNEEKCRELLKIPAERRPVALLPIGLPKSEPPMRDRKPLNDVVTLIK